MSARALARTKPTRGLAALEVDSAPSSEFSLEFSSFLNDYSATKKTDVDYRSNKGVLKDFFRSKLQLCAQLKTMLYSCVS